MMSEKFDFRRCVYEYSLVGLKEVEKQPVKRFKERSNLT